MRQRKKKKKKTEVGKRSSLKCHQLSVPAPKRFKSSRPSSCPTSTSSTSSPEPDFHLQQPPQFVHHELAELRRRPASEHQDDQARRHLRPRRKHLGLLSRIRGKPLRHCLDMKWGPTNLRARGSNPGSKTWSHSGRCFRDVTRLTGGATNFSWTLAKVFLVTSPSEPATPGCVGEAALPPCHTSPCRRPHLSCLHPLFPPQNCFLLFPHISNDSSCLVWVQVLQAGAKFRPPS